MTRDTDSALEQVKQWLKSLFETDQATDLPERDLSQIIEADYSCLSTGFWIPSSETYGVGDAGVFVPIKDRLEGIQHDSSTDRDSAKTPDQIGKWCAADDGIEHEVGHEEGASRAFQNGTHSRTPRRERTTNNAVPKSAFPSLFSQECGAFVEITNPRWVENNTTATFALRCQACGRLFESGDVGDALDHSEAHFGTHEDSATLKREVDLATRFERGRNGEEKTAPAEGL